MARRLWEVLHALLPYERIMPGSFRYRGAFFCKPAEGDDFLQFRRAVSVANPRLIRPGKRDSHGTEKAFSPYNAIFDIYFLVMTFLCSVRKRSYLWKQLHASLWP